MLTKSIAIAIAALLACACASTDGVERSAAVGSADAVQPCRADGGCGAARSPRRQYYDERAGRYYYYDSSTGRYYWEDGAPRN